MFSLESAYTAINLTIFRNAHSVIATIYAAFFSCKRITFVILTNEE